MVLQLSIAYIGPALPNYTAFPMKITPKLHKIIAKNPINIPLRV